MNKYVEKINVRKITQLGLLFALAVVLMFVENLIPPIPTMPPGVKLGLSNIVVMYCLFFLDKKSAFMILLLKSAFVFATRGATSFIMSFSGGLFSILVIILLLLLKKNQMSYVMISICGAISHNIAQLIVSRFILSSTLAYYYAPMLIISGVIMGIITGTILKVMLPALKRVSFIN